MMAALVRGTPSASSARTSGVIRSITASRSAEDQPLVAGMQAPAAGAAVIKVRGGTAPRKVQSGSFLPA
jgi:hypothetical protein